MTAPFLLDANVLIASTLTDHVFHEGSNAWIAEVSSVAVCPAVEGALVRTLVRLGEHPDSITALLNGVHAHPLVEFWSDSISYRHAPLSSVRGHRQVTDVYLVALAREHSARLATFDGPLASAFPDDVLLLDH
ncbi:PIN domain-containing protein [Microbacterium marinilacus]|uniref:Ribonuclease VapC n=1 Tax=Microbacterium marinilacus TaxID=415209 RepID=A0ABP7BLD0_9MICO|nr:PIN domain-containing protein [Microbacterium marinilacus]MBY0689662.1 PIN domain-containing protein [Microbacterium marinilacus]